MATELLTNEALSLLYREHHSWLLGWLNKRVQCRLQAEDHAHDTFVRVMASGRTPDLDEPRPYLATIAKNLLINHWRRATIEQVYLERLSALPEAISPSLEENAIILETLQEIDGLLNRLPVKARKAFFMSQIDGLTYVEIAEKLGVSDRMVRKYMVQAMVLCLSVEF
ncbi:sigma-70 family RNA polymerase sigma factor [Methylomonas sp. MV1]|uniref:sigma-70 family RNA polymerase sigma factor n=1 Tax=Methylomonas sp. MV1 TaxID=3073620 RepID=UPI0028A3CD73|nr:sigma-70 family RNA polymerase sigma factor [Methylomonas sp. MV1]MDT4329086.1 sigma-70 family RNA polymerase sigma factor [Methylomonas sp. MV1]